MEYTVLVLAAALFLGVLTHVLIKINAINRKTGGLFNFHSFIRVEWASISVSVVVSAAALIARNEIQSLKGLGNYLIGAFYLIGLTAQYIAYHANGAARRKVKEFFQSDEEGPKE